MIWGSEPLMTAIDLLVIGLVAGLGIVFWRQRARLAADRIELASLLILGGLALIGLFHLLDLGSMHVLPALIGAADAQAWMTDLHLQTRWLVTLISVSLIGVGLLRFQRDVRTAISQLGDSEARYRSIVRDQHEFIVRWVPAGRLTWANEPFCRAFGTTGERIVGTSFFALMAEPDRGRIKAELAMLTAANPSRAGIHRVCLPDGTTAWQEWTDHAMFDAAGRAIEIQSVGRDVSARVEAEQALARSEARFRGVVESTADWVWEIDQAGRHTYSNNRITDLLGYAPAELDGVHWHELAHPDDLAALDARFNELLTAKAGWERWLVRMRHKDGGFRFFESSATPILDDRDELIGYRGIDRDATLLSLMNRISSKLVGCPAAEVDVRIEESAAEMGFAYGLDRISFWWLDGPYALRSHEWSRSDMHAGPTQAVIHGDSLPWMTAELRAFRRVRLHTLDEIPSGARDRDFLQLQGVKSTLVLPLANEDEMIGVAVFSTLSECKDWTESIESALVQLSEKIVSAYAQAEATRRLVRSERDLVQSEALAQVGSYSYYPMNDHAAFPDEWRAKFSAEQCALLEMDPDDFSFDTFMSRVHEDDRDMVLDAAQRLVSGGESDLQLQFRVVTPSGRLVYIANHTRIDRDASGRNLRIIGANRDITDQIEREQSLEIAFAEIAELRDWLEVENLRLRDEVRSIKGFEQIIGDSAPLKQCLDMVSRAAPTDAAILLLGETGTGKELVAKAIHELSERRERRLVSLNCTALPDELVESELFGHERGAFTGAHRRREGRFALADGGTLFLDEIGDLPAHLQGKLLRVIQDGTFERVGGTETIRVDVRIIAATNRDLKENVARGLFRADLFYRINTITISLPSLRQRKDDIPALAQHFLAKHGPRLNPEVESISAGMLRALQEQDWPGNVRELESYIERSLITAHGRVLTHGAMDLTADGAGFGGGADDSEVPSSDLASVEREHIRRVLADTQWVIGGAGGAASRLGLPPSTLRSRMKKLGIERHV